MTTHYIADVDTKRYGPIEEIMMAPVSIMKNYGLNVSILSAKPDSSYTYDQHLVIKLKWKVELTMMLWDLNDNKLQIPNTNDYKALLFYQKMPSGKFVLQPSNIIDKDEIEEADDTIFLRHVFLLPNDNIVNAVKEYIKELYNSL